MLNQGEHKNNAEQVDDLLKDAFLDMDFNDPRNEAMLEALSASVMAPDAIPKSKKSFGEFIGKINLQSVLFLTIGIIISVISLIVSTDKKQVKKNASEKIHVPVQKKVIVFIDKKEKKDVPEIKKEKKPLTEEEKMPVIVYKDPLPAQLQQLQSAGFIPVDSMLCKELQTNDPEHPATSLIPVYLPAIAKPAENVKEEIQFGFPQFTEHDVKANAKQKKKMIDQLLRPSKPNHVLIPKGTFVFNGTSKVTGGFYMLSHEVTNLEYRTFLFDLIVAKRKTDFLKARPNEELWENCTGNATFDVFKNDYFSDKAFNDYPVVNITADAAKMYCVWLDTLLQAREDEKFEFYVDLPKESEWIYSAKGGHTTGSYPWGKDEIQNPINCFLANFNVQQHPEKIRQPYGYKNKTSATAYTSAGLALNKDTVATVNVFSYNPNAYGLYCMSGNVAEWVLSEDGQTTKAIGGSWGSDFEHLKINSESEFNGKTCSPFIGFRLLVSVHQK